MIAHDWPVAGVAADYRWGTAYVPSFRNHFAAAGLYRVDRSSAGAPAPARSGDLVLFDWPGDPLAHVGMVESDPGDGTLVTWEANTSDRIARKRRPRSLVNGICAVPYPSPDCEQAALDFYRSRDGMGEYPPGSNCNEITAACGLGCVAWCAETASLAIGAGFAIAPPPPAPSARIEDDMGFMFWHTAAGQGPAVYLCQGGVVGGLTGSTVDALRAIGVPTIGKAGDDRSDLYAWHS